MNDSNEIALAFKKISKRLSSIKDESVEKTNKHRWDYITNLDKNDEVIVTYMYIKKCKWKTETKQINKNNLFKFESDKYRILNFMSLDDYYKKLENR